MLISRPDQTAGQPGLAPMPLGAFTGRLLVVLVIAAVAAALWRLAAKSAERRAHA